MFATKQATPSPKGWLSLNRGPGCRYFSKSTARDTQLRSVSDPADKLTNPNQSHRQDLAIRSQLRHPSARVGAHVALHQGAALAIAQHDAEVALVLELYELALARHVTVEGGAD